jgi:hypothetical protein
MPTISTADRLVTRSAQPWNRSSFYQPNRPSRIEHAGNLHFEHRATVTVRPCQPVDLARNPPYFRTERPLKNSLPEFLPILINTHFYPQNLWISAL